MDKLLSFLFGSLKAKIVTAAATMVVVAAGSALVIHQARETGRTYKVVFPFKEPATAEEKAMFERTDVVTYMNWVRTKNNIELATALSGAIEGNPIALLGLVKSVKSGDPLTPYVPLEDITTYQMAQPNYEGTHVPATPVFFQQDGQGRLIPIQKTRVEGVVLRGDLNATPPDEPLPPGAATDNLRILLQDDVGSELHVASGRGDPVLCKRLIDQGANVNARTKRRGLTPLHWAAYCGQANTAHLLIVNGAEIDATDNKNCTALWSCAAPEGKPARGHIEVAKLLLAKGADVNRTGWKGSAPLHIALREKRENLAKFLVLSGASVQLAGHDGEAALHTAVRHNPNVNDMVDFLIQHGANVNAVDALGNTPLHLACSASNGQSAALALIRGGADVNARDRTGESPVELAAKAGQFALVELLVGKGGQFNPNALLRAAANNGNQNLAELAINKGADINIEVLCEAAKRDHSKMVELLISKGANVSATDAEGRTALHWAADGGNAAIALVLIDKGAPINAQDNDGDTPLHVAALYGRLRVAELLINRGADANVRNSSDETPLMLTVKSRARKSDTDALFQLLQQHAAPRE